METALAALIFLVVLVIITFTGDDQACDIF